MDPPVSARHSRLVGGLRKRAPRECKISRRNHPRFNAAAAGGNRHTRTEIIASREASEDFGGSCAKRAMAGDKLTEGRSNYRCRLVRLPFLSTNRPRALERPRPRAHALPRHV